MENIKLILSVYDIIYIICNLFNVYIVAKLMRAVFNNKIVNTKIEFCSYILQFLIVSIVYLLINIPIVLLVTNIILLFIITFNYKAKLRQRIYYTIFIYILFMLLEEIVVLISGYAYNSMFAISNYKSIWGIICIKIVALIAVEIIEKCKSKREGKDIPIIYWISICLIPLISLYMIYILFQKNDLSNSEIVISIFILLFENLIIFYLYDVIILKLENEAKQKLLIQQNNFYSQQLKLMEISIQSTKEIRHDLRNHLSSIRTLSNENKNNSISDYIDKMLNSMYMELYISNTGNIVIDSIINFKYEEAYKKKIYFNLDIKVPPNMEVEDFDITIILGNLLDNAIQAVDKIEDKKINISIKYDKGRLLIKVSNKFNDFLVYNNGELVSTKKDKENHGLGIKNIKDVLDKYKGEINFSTYDSLFSVNIILYV